VSDKQQAVSVPQEAMYLTWQDEKTKAAAMHEVGKALARSEPILRSHGSNIWLDVAPQNISVRDDFNRRDYEAFRRRDMLPSKPKDVIAACMQAYNNVGIVRNVVDLMGDFATQGIDLVHPNERIEKWWKEWFRRVRGKERSERFLNILYRTGNVIIRRHTVKLPASVEGEMRRAQAAPDMDVPRPPKLSKREIPWRYTFLNPLSVEVIADDLTMFVGQEDFQYAVVVPQTLARKVKEPKTAAERAMVSRLPESVRAAIASGDRQIPLDPLKVRGYYYKRDDWQTWANPMVNAILADLQVLQKLKLADLAALDGAISCIRVWKLGSEKHKIMPGPAAINRLAEMLCNNVGGGVMDLVWDFAIDLKETSTDVHRFLGNSKYEPTLTAIYAGLGIPPTLTGAATQGGFTNNYISLKTLTERLQYGRDVLQSFWEQEVREVQETMGFRFPASLVFDRMTLSDEAAEKKLLIDLADRDLISIETIQERFGETPEIEDVRVRREARRRETGLIPPKAGMFHDPQMDYGLKKIFATTGVVSPSEVGLELDEQKKGEQSLVDMQGEQADKQAKTQMQATQQQNDHQFRTEKMQLKHGVHPNQLQMQQVKMGGVKTGAPGRPKNAKDSGPRKKKVVQPRTSAVFFETMAWAENAQSRIGEIAGAAYLNSLGKKNLRQLTDEEGRAFEDYKFHLLCKMEPGSVVDEQVVSRLSAEDISMPTQVVELVKAAVSRHVEQNGGKQPPIEVLRRYRSGAYAFWKGEFDFED
jgi:hypothetical protein